MSSYVPPSGEVVEPPPTWRGYALFGGAAAFGLLVLTVDRAAVQKAVVSTTKGRKTKDEGRKQLDVRRTR